MSKLEKTQVSLPEIISSNEVSKRIYTLRDRQIMLDQDLAEFYGVETKVLKQAVKRNIERFPEDFMRIVTGDELEIFRSQIEAEGVENNFTARLRPKFRSQIVTELPERRSVGCRGGRYAPFAFTEHGVAMLSSVLNSPRAIQINIKIVRIFTQLRKDRTNQIDVTPKLESLETLFNQRFDQLEARLGKPDPAIPLPAKYESISLIKNTVARYFGLACEDLESASRTQPVLLARQIAIFFMKKHLGLGFSAIGRYFGQRDHSTILHAYRKIHVDSEENEAVRDAVRSLQGELQTL